MTAKGRDGGRQGELVYSFAALQHGGREPSLYLRLTRCAGLQHDECRRCGKLHAAMRRSKRPLLECALKIGLLKRAYPLPSR